MRLKKRRQMGGLRAIFSLITLLCIALGTVSARADRPGGVTAQTLKLPTGPASLKGLGESFEPNMSTGTGSYSVPVQLPPGFVAPQVSLNYTGGRGKGVVGQGWSLPVLQIYRQTDKGDPKFTEDDRFSVQGPGLNDELVLVNKEERYYRLKNEGAYALFVRNVEDNSWSIRLPSGQTAYLGLSQKSRESSGGKAYRWFIDKQKDRFGHATQYSYFQDRGRVYLSDIGYQLHTSVNYRNFVSFVYEKRPDRFTDYTYGSACTTQLRLKSIVVEHGSRQVRSYELSYERGLLFSLLTGIKMEGEDGLAMPALSFDYLRESGKSGSLIYMSDLPPLDPLLDGSGELDDVNGDGLPDLIVARHGDYRYYENYDGRRFDRRRNLENSPDRDLFEDGVVFADMNGDGFRDLLHPQDDYFRYYPGGDIRAGVFYGYGEAVDVHSSTDGFLFTGAALKMGDQNGDGRIDLLWQKPGQDARIINGKDDTLYEEEISELPQDIDFGDSRVQYTDFNGDGVMDFVRKEITFNSGNMRVWFGLGRGKYTAEQKVSNVPAGDGTEFYLEDVNKDGQVDLLRVSGSWATYYLNRGDLSFSGAVGSFEGLPASSETQKLLFSDMNGNGSRDIVWITADNRLAYLDLRDEPNAGLLSKVDNGMGLVTSIAYRSSTSYMVEAKEEGEPWVHPLPTPVPVVSEMSSSDSLDTIGLHATVSTTSYEYRDGYYDGKEREFRGFAEATVTSWGDEAHETLVTRTKMHVGRNPITLEDEEVLKGKPFFQVQMGSAGEIFSSVETQWELRHLCQEDIIGAPKRILPDCLGFDHLDEHKDELIALGVSTGALTATYEKTTRPRYTATATSFDAWGNPIESINYGEVGYNAAYQPGEGFDLSQIKPTVGDDEQVTLTKRLYDMSEWLIGLTTESELQDLDGVSYGRTRTYYDGLSFGKASAGLVSKVTRWHDDEDRWIVQEQNEYDEHGNKTATDNAVGDRVELRYDAKSNILPTSERVQIGSGDGDEDWVEFTAEYDRAYGAIVSSVDPNGHKWSMTLDGLGRVVELYDPGGDLPVSKFSYIYGTPEYPVSITQVDQLVERAGRYHTSFSYSDGAGRTRQQKETAEAPHGYIASAWTELSARGKPVRVYDPFATKTAGLQEPPAATPVTLTQLDAMGRPVEVQRPATEDLPDGSRVFTYYLPFETQAYTEKESSLGELQHPVITRMDGLGRVREVEKYNGVRGELQRLKWQVFYDTRGSIVEFADPKWDGKKSDQRHLRHYRYDSLGRLTTVDDPNAGRTDYLFDDLGRVVFKTDPLGQVQEWHYGRAGRLLSHEVRGDAHGAPDYVHQYHYDQVAPNSPLNSAGQANLKGKLSWLEYPTGEEHYSYDELGRVQEEAQRLWDPSVSSLSDQYRDTYHRQIRYRADGQVTQNKAPGGLTLDYNYNERGAVQGVVSRLEEYTRNILAGATYDHRGAVVKSDFGNGVRSCNTFNERGELTGFRAGKTADISCGSSGHPSGGFHNLRYVRGYDGLIDSIEDLSSTDSGIERLDAEYEYDAIQQLIGVKDARGETRYQYDEIQNLVGREIIQDIQDRPVGQFGYGELMSNGEQAGPNAITSAEGESYEYDAAGQMLRYNGYDLRFDGEGRLVEASNATTGVRLVQYYDDAGERRIAIVERVGQAREVHRFVAPEYHIRDGEEVWFAGGGSVTAEIVKSKGVKMDAYLLDQLTAYVNGEQTKPKPLPAEYMDLNGDGIVMDEADLQIALEGYQNEERVGGEKLVWKYITSDHLGGATHITDSNGDLIGHTRFHAYGAVASRKGQRMWRGGYIGKDIEADADLGLQRIGARYYAPKLGRWVTPDPYIGQSPGKMLETPPESSLYGYSGNNSIMMKDPTGLQGTAAQACAKSSNKSACLAKKAESKQRRSVRPTAKTVSKSSPSGKTVSFETRLNVVQKLPKVVFEMDSEGRAILTEEHIKLAMGAAYEEHLKGMSRDADLSDVKDKMGVLDTYFYDISQQKQGKTQVFVYQGKEYSAEQINYLGVGMGFKHFEAFGDSSSAAHLIVDAWNLQYGHLATEGEKKFMAEGFKRYRPPTGSSSTGSSSTGSSSTGSSSTGSSRRAASRKDRSR